MQPLLCQRAPVGVVHVHVRLASSGADVRSGAVLVTCGSSSSSSSSSSRRGGSVSSMLSKAIGGRANGACWLTAAAATAAAARCIPEVDVICWHYPDPIQGTKHQQDWLADDTPVDPIEHE